MQAASPDKTIEMHCGAYAKPPLLSESFLALVDFLFWRILAAGAKSGRSFAKNTKKKGCSKAALLVVLCSLAIEHVHRDFKAKAHIGVFGFGPHSQAPSERVNRTRKLQGHLGR